jgi:uncharacterized protein
MAAGNLRLDRYAMAADLLAAAGAWLTQREAEHNLILGLAGTRARDGQASGPDAPYLATVRRGDVPLLVAVRTPPWNLVLSEVDDEDALRLLADDLASHNLPGVTGPPAAAEVFGRLWTARRGGRANIEVRERIYRLERVKPPATPAPGAARRASAEDRPLLMDWVLAFQREALPEEDADRARRMVSDWRPDTGRQFWIWEERGRPVSLVSAGNPTPRGIRIGPVYTPMAHRGRGYASTLTALVSQRLLDEGRQFCFLYTDLANPTSNRIYQAIGYEPVTDAVMLRFDGAQPGTGRGRHQRD